MLCSGIYCRMQTDLRRRYGEAASVVVGSPSHGVSLEGRGRSARPAEFGANLLAKGASSRRRAAVLQHTMRGRMCRDARGEEEAQVGLV